MIRYPCPACGKVLALADSDVGQSVMCNACGARLRVPRSAGHEPSPSPTAPGAADPLVSLATVASPGPRRSSPAASRRWPGPAWWALFAAAVICAAAIPAAILWRRGGSPQLSQQRTSNPANVRANADLLALKSEAEALAIDGKLAEAHAKYRQLQTLAATRDIKDPLLWDILERAKVDQDHIYTILLAKMQFELLPAGADGPMLPSRALNPPSATSPAATDNSMLAKIPAATQQDVPQPPDLAASRDAGASPTTAPADAVASTTMPAATRTARAMPTTRPTEPLIVPSVVNAAASVPRDSQALTDDHIGAGLERGVSFLIAHYKRGEIPLDGKLSQQWQEGVNALCDYALLQASQSIKDDRLDIQGEFLQQVLEKLKSASMDSDPNGAWEPATYARSLRAAALAVYNRPEDKVALKEDAAWLVTAEVLGAYTYDDRFGQNPARWPNAPPAPPPAAAPQKGAGNGRADVANNPATEIYAHNGEPIPPRMPPTPIGSTFITPKTRDPNNNVQRMTAADVPWDNSNSQYGLMGVWACAESAIEIPDWYWKDVEHHWVACQLRSGEWGYRKNSVDGSLAMTCAGVASLFVTADWLDAGQLHGAVGREPFNKSLAAGLKWLEQGDHCLEIGGPRSHYHGYDLFSLERVGLASGFKHFGTHDWYRELAVQVLRTQWPDGSWGGSENETDKLIETAYHVLFLARGRHPVMMSKLRFDGAWANRPRDLASLARYAAKVLERGVNWQVVSVERDWTDWLDSPVLYIASQAPPKLTEADYAKLRQFAESGGILFTHADAGSDNFTKWVTTDLAKRLWPAYEVQTLPDDHELYGIHEKIRPPHVRLQAIGNGSRLLLVHCPGDLANSWQQRAEKSHPEAFGIGMNLFVYASGKADMRNRLSSPYLPAPAAAAATTVKVARLRYPGNWDPEPLAWTRFSRYLQRETSIAAETAEVNVADLTPSTAPLAHLTGTFAWTPTTAEAATLRNYVSAGGVLLIDACGGNSAFAATVEKGLLPDAFPGAKLDPLAIDDALLRPSATGMVDAGKPLLRPCAALKLGAGVPAVEQGIRVLHYGKGLVVWSPLDLTSGILGATTYGILGYQPAYAEQFVRNLLIWSASRTAQAP
jgi:hypothetical protein